MSVFQPFRGIRPQPESAPAVACPPYDVVNAVEAKGLAGDNELSFLRVIRPEIELADGVDPYSQEVYQQGRANWDRLQAEGHFRQDSAPCFYLYRLTMNGRSQTGVVGQASVEDYYNDLIKKHELTRPDKENDRVNHVRELNAQAEPVFLAYPSQAEINELVSSRTQAVPEFSFTAEDAVTHEWWTLDDAETTSRLESLFAEVPSFYVADGHHRTAAAARVGKERRENNPDHHGNEAYNYLLAVVFPDDQLEILDYNRVVRDLNGLSEEEFLGQLAGEFEVGEPMAEPVRPAGRGEFGLYLGGHWRKLQVKDGSWDRTDPIGRLDVTLLSERVLDNILGIADLRRDKRIDFVGGIRGPLELARRVDSGEMAVAFLMHPVSMEDLLAIADAGQIMPPKTTWFEPKLRSGLVVRSLESG
ncbi:MAG: hypothetical protein CMI30_01485 [Opitutae bacterium]|nr:hypothetical protein [Opitutae bacterium]|tara:strand:+ start:4422 stop:5672 length:1251 start_codon:yes stop_codon:yes gene_type:complete